MRLLAALALPALAVAAYGLWALGSFGALEGASGAWVALLIAVLLGWCALGGLAVVALGWERVREAAKLQSSQARFVAALILLCSVVLVIAMAG